MNPIVIIPAYNPPESLYQLIGAIHKLRPIPIIVVDDGSEPPIKIRSDDIIILRNVSNKGKGFSLNKAFNYAKRGGYTHAVTLDADYQHDPQMLDIFLSVNKNISIVIGKRDFNIKMPMHRRISNNLTSYIISYICRQKVFDSQCGFRRYTVSHVCSAKFIENGFQFESEVLIKLVGKQNYTLEQVDIPTIYNKESSSINNISDTLKFIRLIIRYIFRS